MSVVTAALDISHDTVRRRRNELEGLGIRYAKPPEAVGNTHAYGTTEQWRQRHGLMKQEA